MNMNINMNYSIISFLYDVIVLEQSLLVNNVHHQLLEQKHKNPILAYFHKNVEHKIFGCIYNLSGNATT